MSLAKSASLVPIPTMTDLLYNSWCIWAVRQSKRKGTGNEHGKNCPLPRFMHFRSILVAWHLKLYILKRNERQAANSISIDNNETVFLENNLVPMASKFLIPCPRNHPRGPLGGINSAGKVATNFL